MFQAFNEAIKAPAQRIGIVIVSGRDYDVEQSRFDPGDRVLAIVLAGLRLIADTGKEWFIR